MPDDLVHDATRDQAEKYLVDQATQFDARALRVMADRVLDVVAPEVGEAHAAGS